MQLPTGIIAALVTVFDGQGRPDVEATARHAAGLAERGVEGFLVAGSTGEPLRLSASDRVALVAAVRSGVGPRPVLVGTGHRSHAVAVETTAAVAAAGVADCLVVLSAEDVPAAAHYEAVREA